MAYSLEKKKEYQKQWRDSDKLRKSDLEKWRQEFHSAFKDKVAEDKIRQQKHSDNNKTKSNLIEEKCIANKEKYKGRHKAYKKQYRLDNKNKINEYQNNLKKTNPLFKMRCLISSLIFNSLKKQGYTKLSKTFRILGCTYSEFKIHLEKQFTEGMSWDNQGKWHLDHIYPVSLAEDEVHLIKLNHYTNFQPLWAFDNLSKGNKIITSLN